LTDLDLIVDVARRRWQIRRVRVLGLDVGSQTIGVAVTDELGMCAHAVCTLKRQGTVKDVAAVARLAAEYQVDRLVVGMPYDLEGAEGPRAKRVRVLVDALGQAGHRVELWDERFSTVEAERVLLSANVSRKKRRQVIDKLAAQVILQGWLDARERP
jgi:putative Holliday junction resolvase